MIIFGSITHFLSLHQRTLLILIGRINPIHTMRAICIPENHGRSCTRNANVIMSTKVARSSLAMSTAMPFFASSISPFESVLSPWWIFIHIFPKTGPNQSAPPIQERIVMMMIWSHGSETSIKKKLEINPRIIPM